MSSTPGSTGLMLATPPTPYLNHTNNIRGGRFFTINIQPGVTGTLIDGIELRNSISDQGTHSIVTNIWAAETNSGNDGSFIPVWTRPA